MANPQTLRMYPFNSGSTSWAVIPLAPSITATAISSNTIRINITDNSSNETAFSLERSLTGTGGWTVVTNSIAANATSYDDTVLQPSTTYYYRMRALSPTGNSNYSNTTNAVTGAASEGETLLFFDDFERASISGEAVQNGISWDGSNPNCTIQTTMAKSGTRSVRFRFGPNADGQDSTAELNMRGNTNQLTEYCVRYWLYLPENFYHRTQGGALGSPNNKGVLQSWSGTYGAAASNQFLGFEFWPNGDGSSYLTFRAGRDGADLGHDSNGDGTGSKSMFRLSERGKWIQFKVYIKLASAPGLTDGIVKVWKWVTGEASAELIYSKTNWGYCTRGNYIDSLYYLGWSNSGYAEQTDFYMDRISIASTLLDWELMA